MSAPEELRSEMPPQKQIEIRALHTVAEFEACVELQKAVWGFGDADLVPVRMFVVAHKIGGQIFGAFDAAAPDGVIGYALALPGDRHGHLYLHSHMLAVAAEYRNTGVGRQLKLRQRDDALRRGIELMEWTFDPLEIKNAYFNLERLGAITRRYVPNQYGITSSHLHAGLPTDRLVAEWWMNARRVHAALAGGGPAPDQVTERVVVPAAVAAWKTAGDPRAEAVQSQNREALQQAFARGLTVLGYEKTADGGGAFRLGRWDEAFSYGPPPADEPARPQPIS